MSKKSYKIANELNGSKTEVSVISATSTQTRHLLFDYFTFVKITSALSVRRERYLNQWHKGNPTSLHECEGFNQYILTNAPSWP